MRAKILFKYIKIIIITVLIAMAFYFIAGEQLHYTVVQKDMQEVESIFPELNRGDVIEQKFHADMDKIEAMIFQPFSYGRENRGMVDFFVEDKTGAVITATSARAVDCVDYMPYTMTFGQEVPLIKGDVYTLRIVINEDIGNNPTFYYTTQGYDEANAENVLTLNGNTIPGNLCLGMKGKETEWFGAVYWYFVLILIVFLIAYQLWADYQTKRGKFTVVTLMLAIWKRYRFLIEQLVSRDFKIKYKRSVLGYCWSFLNPLLTMLVQYLVFSTIFRMGIENFPVYLLSGNIIFSFFTEAVGQGITAIVGNAALITKVYVPKYIYPITKVLSTSINLFISVIPLLLVALITGEEITATILLLPFALLCLLIFTLGVVLLLSSLNVFFRDVQYLWNIISLVWMYATPIFYPADIIPEKFKLVQTLNPLYHIIVLVRTVLMDGVSPRPEVYLYCLLGSTVSLALGMIIFKKTQGKFALYI